MTFELINNQPARPGRIEALLSVLENLDEPVPKDELGQWLWKRGLQDIWAPGNISGSKIIMWSREFPWAGRYMHIENMHGL